MLLTSQYNPATGIINSSSNFIDADDVNNLLTPVTSHLQSFDNLKAVTFTSSSGTPNFTINPNEHVIVYVNASANNATIILPLGAQQTASSILVKKIDSSTNTVTIVRSGSDVIENLNTNTTTPDNTSNSFVLDFIGESVELYPTPSSTNVWRIMNYYINKDLTYIEAINSGTQSISANITTLVSFDNAITNPLSLWNTGTNKYTVRKSGIYIIEGSVDMATITNYQIQVFANDSASNLNSLSFATTEQINFMFTKFFSKGNTIDIRATAPSNNIHYARNIRISMK